jgi:chromosome segregation ATPase
MSKIAFLVSLLVASAALCQTQAKEPDTLQSLLMEVHQLRQDIEAMTVASQRVQIALYTLQMQDASVARTTQRLDEARNRCKGEEGNRQHIASEIQSLESNLSRGVPEAETKMIQSRLTQLKSALDVQAAAVQTCQSVESELSNQLRNDQAKLAELQDRVQHLDKTLEQLGVAGK